MYFILVEKLAFSCSNRELTEMKLYFLSNSSTFAPFRVDRFLVGYKILSESINQSILHSIKCLQLVLLGITDT